MAKNREPVFVGTGVETTSSHKIDLVSDDNAVECKSNFKTCIKVNLRRKRALQVDLLLMS